MFIASLIWIVSYLFVILGYLNHTVSYAARFAAFVVFFFFFFFCNCYQINELPIPELVDWKPIGIRNVRTIKFNALKFEHKLIIDPICLYKKERI